MNETIQVTLDAKLLEELQQTVTKQGVSLGDIFADAAQKYLDEARRKKIQKEFEHYTIIHAELKTKYLGQHVAIHEGQVVDHDADLSELIHRVRLRYGRIPIMFTQVGEQPMREFVVHSMHRVDSK